MVALILLISMFVMHYLSDWILQTDVVAKYKQQENWTDLIRKNSMYINDYKVVMTIHCMFWSICINIPLIISDYIATKFETDHTLFFGVSIVINLIIHWIVDDLKANKEKINLTIDQYIHYCQIGITMILYFILLYPIEL